MLARTRNTAHAVHRLHGRHVRHLAAHAAHHLHHLLHLLILSEHAIDVRNARSASFGDAVLARCLQAGGILPLIVGHAQKDGLALLHRSFRREFDS